MNQSQLNAGLVTLGETELALDDIIAYLGKVSLDVDLHIYGDPKFVEIHLNNVENINNGLLGKQVSNDYFHCCCFRIQENIANNLYCRNNQK